jgi:DNA (cytosine-5)-methyltransferase 1
MKRKNLKTIDLFAGIGGMRLGFEEVGFKTVYANDVDKYACKTYEANFGKIDNRDLKTVSAREIPDFDILLAGFPCQPFSMIGKRDGLNDKRGEVFFEIIRILNERKPTAFLLENVKYLQKHGGGKTFELIENELKEAGDGYDVFSQVLDSKNFGVPQHRERIYIVGLKKTARLKFNFPQGIKSKARNNLKGILEKKVPEKYYLSEKYYLGLLNHKKRHQQNGSGFGCEVLDTNRIANTIVCGNMGRERNLIKDRPCKKNRWGVRRLTEREYARLQGFPDSFKIPVSMTQAYKQFGNAVTVPVIKEIAAVFKEILST